MARPRAEPPWPDEHAADATTTHAHVKQLAEVAGALRLTRNRPT